MTKNEIEEVISKLVPGDYVSLKTKSFYYFKNKEETEDNNESVRDLIFEGECNSHYNLYNGKIKRINIKISPKHPINIEGFEIKKISINPLKIIKISTIKSNR